MTGVVNSPDFWDDIYKHKKVGWDLRSPTPVFMRIIKEKKIIQSGKILILGSGYGYDAVEAAKEGFDITAVDFSMPANIFAEKLAKDAGVNINFLTRDFFDLPPKYYTKFDAVYDYVTYCAIEPTRREEYVKLITSSLKYTGIFIALLFPIESRDGGPPYGIDLESTEKIFKKYLELISSSIEDDTIKPRKGREVLQIYRKVQGLTDAS